MFKPSTCPGNPDGYSWRGAVASARSGLLRFRFPQTRRPLVKVLAGDDTNELIEQQIVEQVSASWA